MVRVKCIDLEVCWENISCNKCSSLCSLLLGKRPPLLLPGRTSSLHGRCIIFKVPQDLQVEKAPPLLELVYVIGNALHFRAAV